MSEKIKFSENEKQKKPRLATLFSID